MSQQLLSERDLASMLQVHVMTVRRWRISKTGPAFIRCGTSRPIRYQIEAVNRWLLARQGKKFRSAAA